MIRKKKWFITFNHARIDVVLIIDLGRVIGFSLNLSVEAEGEKHDIVRWDTAHGYLHKHEFWETTKTIKESKYENTPLDIVFREQYEDLRKNWEEYVKRWENARKNT